MQDKNHVSRSQELATVAETLSPDDLKKYIENLFAVDLRKATEYSETQLHYTAKIALDRVRTQFGFKESAVVTKKESSKYTKKLELSFSAKAVPEYRSFILKGLEKDSIVLSTKGDTVLLAFQPEKIERAIVRLKPLVNVMVHEIK